MSNLRIWAEKWIISEELKNNYAIVGEILIMHYAVQSVLHFLRIGDDQYWGQEKLIGLIREYWCCYCLHGIKGGKKPVLKVYSKVC